MPYSARLEVHFHDQDVVSVFMEASEGGAEARKEELFLFCLFALRQVSNLGSSGASLAQALALVAEGGAAMLLGDDGSPPQLIQYPGHPGRKGFVVTFSSGERVHFQLKPQGFGLFGRGLGYYAPISVIALARYLAQKRRMEGDYITALRWAARECGSASVGVASHADIALIIAARAGAHLHTGPPLDFSYTNMLKAQIAAEEESLLAELTRNAATIDREQLYDTFSPGGHSVVFTELDPSTQSAFNEAAGKYAQTFYEKYRPADVTADSESLVYELGAGVMEGYVLGRRALGTHKSPVSYSEGVPRWKVVGALLKRKGRLKPLQLLEMTGNKELALFPQAWAHAQSASGLYAEIADREEAAFAMLVPVINGLSLAFAEFLVARAPQES